jgi:hypothetical protein
MIFIVTALLAPIWTVRYLPLIDYPNHLASAFVLAHLNDSRFHFQSFYASDWNSYPYLMMSGILVLLQKIVSIDVAGRLLLSVAVLSLPAAAWWFLREVNPGQEVLALWTLITAQNLYFFLYGFINMQLSLALCLLLLAGWVRWVRNPRAVSWCFLLVGATVLYFTHLMGVAIAGVALSVYTIVDQWRVRYVLVSWALFIPSALFYLHAEWNTSSSWIVTYRPIAGKFVGLLVTVLGVSIPVDFFTLIIAGLSWFLAFQNNRSLGWQAPWLASAGALFVLYWVFPAGYGPGLNADRRLLPFILAIGLAAVKVGRRVKPLAVIALLLFFMRATAIEYHFLSVQTHLKKIVVASSMIPPGSRVLPLAPFGSGVPLVERQIWAYGVITRGWFSPCLFHDPGAQPFAIRLKIYNPYVPSSCDDLKHISWERVSWDYDYVWAYNTPAYDSQLQKIAKFLYGVDGLRVYKIKRSPAESVGRFGFGSASKRVVRGNFHRLVDAESIGSPGHHSDLVVEALNRLGENPSFGPEPVQQEFLVGAQHAGHPLQRLQAAAHGSLAPIVEEGFGSDQRSVGPEMGPPGIPGPRLRGSL